MSNFLLKQDGSYLLLNPDGTNAIQLEDGTDLLMEDGTTQLLLEQGDHIVLQLASLSIDALAGAYTITGSPVTFTLGHAQSYTAGSYTITGYPTTLAVSRVLPVFVDLLIILPDESRFI